MFAIITLEYLPQGNWQTSSSISTFFLFWVLFPPASQIASIPLVVFISVHCIRTMLITSKNNNPVNVNMNDITNTLVTYT